MEELRQTFLIESISRLTDLRLRLQAEEFAPELQRELFRALHTIKGTAQTFGLRISANLAHALENVLTGARDDLISAADCRALLLQGLEVLTASLTDRSFQIPPTFIEKMRPFRAQTEPVNPFSYLSGVPESVTAHLSNQEKTILNSALADGCNLTVLEIGFDAARLADEFKSFRENLSKDGEIIATLPSARFAAGGQIGFQIVFAHRGEKPEITKNFHAEIIFQIHQGFPVEEPGILGRIVGHGKSLAAAMGKKIEFETFSNVDDVQPGKLNLIFDILLHLVRNAIDHGIEREGKIRIEISSAKGRIYLLVADNGRGIDLEKVRRRAVEKNLIASGAGLSESDVLNLIFAHGFSTSETVSEISGRGVGLDAVKDRVEKAGGEILVRSHHRQGTTFEIWL